MNDSLLNITSVSFAYPQSRWSLQNVSLNIAAGQIVGVIGPNGAGKSTLLKIAAGILDSTSGSVRLTGQNIHKLSRRRIARLLGYLPQNVTSTFDYRVEEIVAMGRFPHLSGVGFLQPDDLDLIEHCLEQTETTEYRHRRLSQLSGGERQRVLLASVLAQQPRVLLLDEPTTGLDLHHQVAFFGSLSRLAQDGLAVAVVTHDLNLASQFCNRLLLMRDGQTVVEGPADAVMRQDILSDVYRHSVHVAVHPLTQKPNALPMVQYSPAPDQKDRPS